MTRESTVSGNDNERVWIMKFRKKPVVIEAVEFTEFDSPVLTQRRAAEVSAWIEEGDGEVEDYGSNFIEIETLEGTMTARPGDWIIRGVQGEFYPCKPDIFEQTYEAVEEPADSSKEGDRG